MENKKENTPPLYKVLDGKRTQGIWKQNPIPAYQNEVRIIKNSEKLHIATFNIMIGDVGEPTINAQYATLAVNNLVPLAEALSDLIYGLDVMKQGGLFIPGSIIDIDLQKAKEALNKIS